MQGLIETDRGFYKKMLAIAVPVTLQSVVTLSVNLADTVMLTRLGETFLSASSLANNFYHIFHVLCLGIGFGAAVMTAQFWGSRDLDGLKKTLTIMLRIVLVASLGFMVATLVAPGFIMSVYTPDAEIIAYGTEYLRVMAFTYLLLGVSQTLTIVLRSVGVVRLPLFVSIGSLLLNVAGNWLLIFGNLGFPRLGIVGAAVSTAVARVFEFTVIVIYLLKADTRIGYRLRDLFAKCGDLMKSFTKYSAPVIVSDILLALGMSATAMVMGRIGSAFVAANAIIAVINQFCTIYIQGLSSAGSILTGNALGEGRQEDAYRQGVTLLLIGTAVGLLSSVAIVLAGPTLLAASGLEPETMVIARQLLQATAFIVLFRAMNSIMTKGVLRGGGDTRFLMVADILFLWVLSIPLGCVAAFLLNLSPFWIFTCLYADQIVKAVWCVFRLKSRKWIKVVARQAG